MEFDILVLLFLVNKERYDLHYINPKFQLSLNSVVVKRSWRRSEATICSILLHYDMFTIWQWIYYSLILAIHLTNHFAQYISNINDEEAK